MLLKLVNEAGTNLVAYSEEVYQFKIEMFYNIVFRLLIILRIDLLNLFTEWLFAIPTTSFSQIGKVCSDCCGQFYFAALVDLLNSQLVLRGCGKAGFILVT